MHINLRTFLPSWPGSPVVPSCPLCPLQKNMENKQTEAHRINSLLGRMVVIEVLHYPSTLLDAPWRAMLLGSCKSREIKQPDDKIWKKQARNHNSRNYSYKSLAIRGWLTLGPGCPRLPFGPAGPWEPYKFKNSIQHTVDDIHQKKTHEDLKTVKLESQYYKNKNKNKRQEEEHGDIDQAKLIKQSR